MFFFGLTMFFVTVSYGASDGPVVPGTSLPDAINKNLLGIQTESTGQLAAIKKDAQSFINFRRGRMSSKDKLLWIAGCLGKEKDNIFCNYIVERKSGKYVGNSDNSEGLSESQIADLLAKASLKELSTATERQVIQALKLFPAWEPLQPVASAVIASKSCYPTAITTGLGLKAEEYFPATKYRKLAAALYSKANDCGDGETVDKVRFRLAMIMIWNGRCKQAEPLLLKLSEQSEGDYVSRALYWRVHCAKQSGNKLLATTLKSRLLKEYSLTYHALLLSEVRNSSRVVKVLGTKEPYVTFRSKKLEELNRVVRAVEVLHTLSANDLAQELLESQSNQFGNLENSMKLYVTVLFGKFGDRISQFKLLAEVFRDEPTMIARSTLQLFYPLRRFDVLKKHRAKVDPYLIAALIRQESAFSERARSPAGALGLMQLMPKTARRMERVSKRELFDAKTNIRLGVKYYSKLLSKYRSDAELALAAYNAGPEKVDEWLKRYETSNRILFLDLIPFKETSDYVALISRNYYWYISLYADKSSKKPLKFKALRFHN